MEPVWTRTLFHTLSVASTCEMTGHWPGAFRGDTDHQPPASRKDLRSLPAMMPTLVVRARWKSRLGNDC